MRLITPLFLPLLLFACAAPTPERATEAPAEEKHSAADTDRCLDNPELARTWGDCNVKHTVYLEADTFAKCRKTAPTAKGTVNFQLRVKADGSVRSAKALGEKGNKGKLVACLSRAMKKLQFAAPPKGKEPTITVPYLLEP